jgi:hypothetical protein
VSDSERVPWSGDGSALEIANECMLSRALECRREV